MTIRNSILLGTLGHYADRFHQYQPPRSLEERLELSKEIPLAHGIEPVYPQDLGRGGEAVDLVKLSGIAVSAVNVNVKSEDKFRAGAFTNPDPKVRAEAVTYLKNAMDLAAELSSDMISVCPLIDGWDYAFQVDYQAQWRWLVAAFREAAAHRSDIRISIEYKPFESRNHIVVSNMGRALHLCNVLAVPNVGVTLDIGHALAGGETPAAELCLAHDAGRLFYVHFNDNDRRADWDMLPGAVNFWDTLEALYYLEHLDWDGWFAYDVFTRHGDPAETVAATFAIMEDLKAFIKKIGLEELRAIRAEGLPARAFMTLVREML